MVEIIDYQDRWPVEFREIAAQLRTRLGPLALRIDHIGSTSVPGLPAKDIIDVQITVAALDERIAAAMTTLGYLAPSTRYRDHVPPSADPTETEWEKLFFHSPVDARRSHTHVRVLGRANQRYPLLFRDYLRSHPTTAAAYAEVKRRLSTGLADPSTYPEVKEPSVDLIYLAAEEWAQATGWEPGPSDG